MYIPILFYTLIKNSPSNILILRKEKKAWAWITLSEGDRASGGPERNLENLPLQKSHQTKSLKNILNFNVNSYFFLLNHTYSLPFPLFLTKVSARQKYFYYHLTTNTAATCFSFKKREFIQFTNFLSCEWKLNGLQEAKNFFSKTLKDKTT